MTESYPNLWGLINNDKEGVFIMTEYYPNLRGLLNNDEGVCIVTRSLNNLRGLIYKDRILTMTRREVAGVRYVCWIIDMNNGIWLFLAPMKNNLKKKSNHYKSKQSNERHTVIFFAKQRNFKKLLEKITEDNRHNNASQKKTS